MTRPRWWFPAAASGTVWEAVAVVTTGCAEDVSPSVETPVELAVVVPPAVGVWDALASGAVDWAAVVTWVTSVVAAAVEAMPVAFCVLAPSSSASWSARPERVGVAGLS